MSDPSFDTSPAPAGIPPLPLLTFGYRATPTTLAVGAQALARITYPWRTLLPRWSLRFAGPETGFLGRTLWPERVIEIYVRPGHDVDDVAFALAHELGHAVDLEHLDPTGRARWRSARRIHPFLEWFGDSDSNDFATPAGDWAECFAAWQVGPNGFQSELAGPPDDAIVALIAHLSLHNGDFRGAPDAASVQDDFPISRLKPTG